MVNVKFDVRWSNNLTQQFINDFIFVENEVLFCGYFTEDYFKRKFLENIYGPSVLVVAYADDKPVGSNAFWRNDINGEKAFQSVDSCVLPKYEGLLIYMDMNDLLIDEIGKETLLYGFPNHNSGPIAVKRKTNIIGHYRPVIYMSHKRFSTEHGFIIPFRYANWWIKMSNSQIYYVKKNNHYYLVKLKRKKFLLFIVGEVDEKTAMSFPKYDGLFYLLTYYSIEKKFYNKNYTPIIITSSKKDMKYIPFWKIDAI